MSRTVVKEQGAKQGFTQEQGQIVATAWERYGNAMGEALSFNVDKHASSWENPILSKAKLFEEAASALDKLRNVTPESTSFLHKEAEVPYKNALKEAISLRLDAAEIEFKKNGHMYYHEAIEILDGALKDAKLAGEQIADTINGKKLEAARTLFSDSITKTYVDEANLKRWENIALETCEPAKFEDFRTGMLSEVVEWAEKFSAKGDLEHEAEAYHAAGEMAWTRAQMKDFGLKEASAIMRRGEKFAAEVKPGTKTEGYDLNAAANVMETAFKKYKALPGIESAHVEKAAETIAELYERIGDLNQDVTVSTTDYLLTGREFSQTFHTKDFYEAAVKFYVLAGNRNRAKELNGSEKVFNSRTKDLRPTARK